MKKLFLPCLLLLSNLAFAQVNLNNGLIAHYPFTGNANDVSGNNINGVVSNATLTTDRNGNANSAYYFNGSNAYVLLPYSNLYNFGPQDSFSISVWVLPDAGYTWPAQAVVVKAPPNPDFTLSLWNYGTYIFNYRAMSGYAYNNVTNGTTTLSPNACWYNLVSTYKNGVWRLYVNGVLESENTTQTRFILQDGFSRIAFGKKGESFGDWYKGKMDEVRIYNRVLNQEEINAIVGTCQTPCNNWLSLPSYQSYVNVGDLDVPGNTITVEALFSRTAPYSNGYNWAGDLVSKHVDPVDVNYLLRPNNAEITTTNGYFTTPPICEIELNKVYHAAMVYDGSSLKFYRNGYLMSSVAATGNMFQNNHQTRIGLYDALFHNTNLIGYINEVRIWNVARTQTQIKSFMNTSLPSPATQTGLLAYYTFDNLLNKQGNPSWNGTLGGSAVINATNPQCTFTADSCAITVCSPKTDFSYTQNICNPYSITFSSTSNTYQSILWDFGDNTTASAASTVTHTYATTGNYTVTMIQQFANCADTVQKTFSVTIQNDPQTILTSDTTICLGSSKQLNAALALSYCWSPAAFLSDPSIQNPVTSAPGTTTYYLASEKKGTNLIVNGNFSAGNSGFTSQYSYNAASGINPGVYTVSNNPVAWHPQMPACTDHTGAGGNGNMMIVNGAQTANVNVWTQTVTVQPNTNYAFETWVQHMTSVNPAQLQFSINGVLIGPVFTANNTSCIWDRFFSSWNSGNNTTATIAIVNQNQVFTGNDFALDDISFAPIIVSRDSVTITVDTPFVYVSNDTTVCAGTSVQLTASGSNTYSWSPALHLSNTNLANPVATPTNTTKYFVTGTNTAGCTITDSITVTVNPLPVVSISNDTLVCTNSSVQLVAAGGTSYNWLPAGTLSNSAIPNPVATPSATSTYSVTVTDNNNCSSSDSVIVSVRPPNSFTLAPSFTICSAESVQLIASGGDVYSWSPAALLSNTTVANPIATPSATTDFTVAITDTLCSYTETLSTTVTVLPLPTLSVTKSNDIDCSNNSSRLSVTGASQYLWRPSVSLNNPGSSNPIATPAETTTYIVTGTDLNGCVNTDSINVLVTNTNKGGYLMPNAFTPNNDGVNDCYGISSWGIILELEFSIYNRWGERVFYTTEPSKCWDGTFRGVQQNPGMFTYSIKAKTSCESYIVRKGVFSLIR